ncbi:2-oxoacid:acceptor oxidoreductase family protein [Magnetospirillum sulfuroxidans]|uniref:2-oxoacid:acceptor oxidoreductase family protein n=1 Tax=Magnetospirillum sulfuroxidans TaxID=611300 RepID=A0ABS5I8C0_9PROT|nr:2-oxoacid:acceptor oxidoreductase family protein [Magnetospirillum sulfuroxidans]MBR9970501.1 2-oxoacid:acceptor oxidoreductase family protein [Magnetospirillum sulfuroxidans]
MIEVRIHGRGGQGNVVAAYLLATAAFETGRHCQAFPSFGAERRGAPVTAFVRIADHPIRRRCQVATPAFLVVQDAGLLHIPATLDGLIAGGGILVNSPRTSAELTQEYARPMTALPATALAQDILGRPVPNVALLSAFLALTGLMPAEALVKALAHRFKGDVLDRNTRLIEAVTHHVAAGAWKEIAHA